MSKYCKIFSATCIKLPVSVELANFSSSSNMIAVIFLRLLNRIEYSTLHHLAGQKCNLVYSTDTAIELLINVTYNKYGRHANLRLWSSWSGLRNSISFAVTWHRWIQAFRYLFVFSVKPQYSKASEFCICTRKLLHFSYKLSTHLKYIVS